MEIIEVRGLLKELSIRLAKDEFEIYNITPGEIRPTNYAPILSRNDDGIYFENAKWGYKNPTRYSNHRFETGPGNLETYDYKPYTGTGVIFNARAETIDTKPTFAKSVRNKRCVVPASEYFEWQDMGKGKKKRKHHAKDKEGNILYMAGLYRDTPDGREYVVITKDAFGDVTKIHDRMPVLLKADQIPAWLSGELSSQELSMLDVELDVTPTEKDTASEGEGQIRLFSL